MRLYDVAVVGAGIAGSRVAGLISQKGYDVLLIEEHEKIGLPSKCTGLVSFRLLKLVPNLPKEIIVNRVKSAKFFSPNGNFFELKPRYSVYVINRVELDRFLFNQVTNATKQTNEKFESFKYAKNFLKIKTNKKIYYSKILIGADGANSLVRKTLKIDYPKNFLVGLQATVKGNFDSGSVELWFGNSIAPNFFAWVVPENEYTARIGLATNSNVMKYYKSFLQRRSGYICNPDTSGVIRYGLMKETSFDRVMLVGDAACMVKPFSGGGIIYGLISSDICADACISSLEMNRFDKNFLKENYDKRWKEKLENPIRRGLFCRRILNMLSDRQLNFFFPAGKILKLYRLLESWDMDFLRDD